LTVNNSEVTGGKSEIAVFSLMSVGIVSLLWSAHHLYLIFATVLKRLGRAHKVMHSFH